MASSDSETVIVPSGALVVTVVESVLVQDVRSARMARTVRRSFILWVQWVVDCSEGDHGVPSPHREREAKCSTW